MNNTPWSTADINLLKGYVSQNLSASQIGIMMNKPKGAIVGKITRLHLLLYRSRKFLKDKSILPAVSTIKRKARIHLPGTIDKLAMKLAAEQHQDSTILDFPEKGECKWIYGDVKVGSGHWCYAPICSEGKSWCRIHYHHVYQRR